MLHPHTKLQFISAEVGNGIVATHFIPKGTITWVQDQFDAVFNDEQIVQMSDMHKEILEVYAFKNNKGESVLCWDLAKYVNHSFRSNCLTTPYDFEIAIRDIHPGEELTDDYGYLNISRPFKGIDEKTKRKVVYPDDLLKYHTKWDKQIEKIFPLIKVVNQPLLEYMSINTLEKIDNINKGAAQLDSILNCYYNPTVPQAK